MNKTPKGLRKVIRTEIGQTMLTNVRRGNTVPDVGEPWRAFLFVQSIYQLGESGEKRGQVHVEVLEADTRDALDQELVAFVETPGRVLLEEGFELQSFRDPVRRATAARAEASK